MNITKFAIPELIFGRGSIKHIGRCALRLGGQKVFLVSDPGIEKAGWVSTITQLLDEAQIEYIYHSQVQANPRDVDIEEGAKRYREEGADVIIALGGGSALDTAKGIAIIASNGGRIRDYEGANRVNYPLPPMILITTTAGSGSEVSQFCIITDMQRRTKMSIITRTLIPNLAIVDPILLTTKSKRLIIHSAVDALSHAIEAYLSKLASPFTEMHSLQAITLIHKFLPKTLDDPSIDNLEQLSIASVSASMAFSNASLGAEHALAHTLGGYFDVAHGSLHPILLPAVMRFNLTEHPKKLATIAQHLGIVIPENKMLQAECGISRLEQFFQQLPIPTTLIEILGKVDPKTLQELCKAATEDACIITNPRQPSWQDLYQICIEVWQ